MTSTTLNSQLAILFLISIRRVCDVRRGVSNRTPFVLNLFALLQITITEDGAAANFTRSFGMKSGYYLCYSKVTDRDQIKETLILLIEHVSLHYHNSSCIVYLQPFVQTLYLSLSVGLGKWYGFVWHSAYFRQGLYSSWFLLYSRVPWTKWVHIRPYLSILVRTFTDTMYTQAPNPNPSQLNV